jgi:5-methylcytosine-specific restriction endonuclease McrA
MTVPTSAAQFAESLRKLRQQRESAKDSQKGKGSKRKALSSSQRQKVLEKTDGRCHICGGKVGAKWHADHVLAHSAGGEHSAENYLPAHQTCNNHRWDYLPEEFELILKLGVWARTQIEKETSVGQHCADTFLKYEKRQMSRSGRAS